MAIASSVANHIDTIIDEIPGWLLQPACYFTAHCMLYQKEKGITGNLVEIGTFKGKYLSLLYLHVGENEVLYGFDAFIGHKQSKWAKDEVINNIIKYCGDCDRLEIICANTLEITPEEMIDRTTDDVRFISIDGGHTADVVYNDLHLATSILKKGGIIALDDAFCHAIPDVTEALFKFLFNQNEVRLAPFAHCYNKLFLTTADFYKEYLKLAYQILEKLKHLPTYELTKGRLIENRGNGYVPKIFDYEILCFM